MARAVLALDQGTTSSRAILFSHEGKALSTAQEEFPQIYPSPGHVEHDPEAIWSSQLATAREAIRQALRGVADGPAFDQGAAVTSVDQIAGLNDEQVAMAEELLANGAQITSDGRVRVFHRTTPEAARMVEASGVMRGAEDGVFFSTRADGQAEGYGAGVVEALVPISRLQLDDVFGDERLVAPPVIGGFSE